MHVLIAGMTLSGKTTVAKKLAAEYQRAGYKTIVLDPLNDPEWAADYQTRNAEEFLEVVKRSRSCALFIDESGESIGKFNDSMFWLATRARHYGHKSHFITQRPQMLSRTIWTQCADLFLFNISEHDAKLLSDEWNQKVIREAGTLQTGECFHARKMGGIKRINFRGKTRVDASRGNHDTSGTADVNCGRGGDDRAGYEGQESAIGAGDG